MAFPVLGVVVSEDVEEPTQRRGLVRVPFFWRRFPLGRATVARFLRGGGRRACSAIAAETCTAETLPFLGARRLRFRRRLLHDGLRDFLLRVLSVKEGEV